MMPQAIHTLNYNPTHHIKQETSWVTSVFENSRMLFSEHHLHWKDLFDKNNMSSFTEIFDGIYMKQVRQSASVRPYLPDSSHHVSGFWVGMSGIFSELLSSRCNTDFCLLEHNQACSLLWAFVCTFWSVVSFLITCANIRIRKTEQEYSLRHAAAQ